MTRQRTQPTPSGTAGGRVATRGTAQQSERSHLYTDLASWWPLLSPPSDYAEEAAALLRVLGQMARRPLQRALELGSGGGHTASHLKAQLEMTLVDLSPDMVEVSRTLNPECRHLVGDMRTVHLGCTFDAVLLHDAVAYMTTREDLRRAMVTAWEHLAPGGVALFCPDCTRESFLPGAQCGGTDGKDRAMRYLEWMYDPDPDDETYTVDIAYLTRIGTRPPEVSTDHWVLGLFAQLTWLDLLTSVGFVATPVTVELATHGSHVVFAGLRQPAAGRKRSTRSATS